MPERIDARPVLAAIGGVLLLVSLSLTWYVIPGTPPAADTDIGNAWGVFETLDIVLAAIGAASLYLAYEQLAGHDRVGTAWLLPLGMLALLIVAAQIIDPPPTVEAPIPPAGTIGPAASTGAWLALAGSGALAVAGVLSRASVSLAVTMDSGRERSRRPAHESSVPEL